jgi:hypothetical protein
LELRLRLARNVSTGEGGWRWNAGLMRCLSLLLCFSAPLLLWNMHCTIILYCGTILASLYEYEGLKRNEMITVSRRPTDRIHGSKTWMILRHGCVILVYDYALYYTMHG